MKNFFRNISEHFYSLELSGFDRETLHQAKRCLLDYTGCAVFSAAGRLTPKIIDLIESLGGTGGRASIWGSKNKTSPALAAFANSLRTSNIEMDDYFPAGTAHPGVYVISAALAAAEENNSGPASLLRGIIFGYDVVSRLGAMAAFKARELGLHGPGLVGGFGAAASAGLVAGLSVDQLCNVFGITGALLPLCPFISFIEGSDAKDFYGGWGVYLAMLAVESAKRGITGPSHILDGVKSLSGIFCGKDDTDFGKPYLIDSAAFKRFSACQSVHPAVSAILELRRQSPIMTEDIASLTISTYPYAYSLHQGAGENLNPSSARLSLSYTAAFALTEGHLMPQAFFMENLTNEKYLSLRKKIHVEKNEAYGDGPWGTRGAVVEIYLKNGSRLKHELTQWERPDDEELVWKFNSLSQAGLDKKRRDDLAALVFDFERRTVNEYLEYLRNLDTGD